MMTFALNSGKSDGGKPDVEFPHSHALFPFFQGTEDAQPHLPPPDRDEVDLGCCWGLHLPEPHALHRGSNLKENS